MLESLLYWARGMGCACHPRRVLQYQESCAGQWSVQWGVWHGSYTLVYHGAFSTLTKCIFDQVQGMEGWHGKLRAPSQHKEDEVPGLWFWPGCPPQSGKYPCAVCCNGVDRNSILFSQCMWVHKRSSGVTKWLVADKNYVCPRCKYEFRPIDGRTVKRMLTALSLIWKDTFCYLGDMLCSSVDNGKLCVNNLHKHIHKYVYNI